MAWSPSTPCASSAISIPPSVLTARSSSAECAAVSSRSATAIVTAGAPRVSKSSRTAASFCSLRATRKKLAPCSASRRSVASAIADVAPSATTRFGRFLFCASAIERSPSCHPLPKRRVESRIHIPRKILPLRIKRLILFRRHARVLRGVHPPTMLQRDLCQPLYQIEAHLPPDGKIQGQHHARRRKRHHPRRRHIAKKLDHCQERRQARLRDRLQNLQHSFAPRGMRNHVLELQQPLLPVHPVPAQHRIQRIEERLIVHRPNLRLPQLLVEVQRVERRHGEPVQRYLRQVQRKHQLRFLALRQRTRYLRMISLHEDAARKIPARRHAVDPRH